MEYQRKREAPSISSFKRYLKSFHCNLCKKTVQFIAAVNTYGCLRHMLQCWTRKV